MSEIADRLRRRTHEFFVRVMALCEGLTDRVAAESIGQQLIDSAGSTDSNYRAACRARSKKEFIAKIGTAIEEVDESAGWLQALKDARLCVGEELNLLIQEADELTRILVKSKKTAELNLERETRAAKAAKRQKRAKSRT